MKANSSLYYAYEVSCRARVEKTTRFITHAKHVSMTFAPKYWFPRSWAGFGTVFMLEPNIYNSIKLSYS